MSNIVIYKAIFGGYDNPPKPLPRALIGKYRFVLITDTDTRVDGWETRLVKKDDGVFSNRHSKMFPWDYFDADISIYLDGHIEFGVEFLRFIEQCVMSNADFAVMPHRSRGNVSDELIRCIDNDKIGRAFVASVMESELQLHFPAVECGMIFRRHSVKEVREHSQRWWWYFCNVCPRDQLSVQTAAADASLELTVLDFDFSKTEFFIMVGHKNRFLNLVMSRLKIAARIFFKGTLLKE